MANLYDSVNPKKLIGYSVEAYVAFTSKLADVNEPTAYEHHLIQLIRREAASKGVVVNYINASLPVGDWSINYRHINDTVQLLTVEYLFVKPSPAYESRDFSIFADPGLQIDRAEFEREWKRQMQHQGRLTMLLNDPPSDH